MQKNQFINDYENSKIPSFTEARKIAGAYLQARIHNGSNPRIIYEHGVHIYNVAKIAQSVAEETRTLNPRIAYVLGLLHDVGRVRDETVTGVPHTIEGYYYLRQQGEFGVAPICLSHNFIKKDIIASDYPLYSAEQLNEVREILSFMQYNDYDRLIQMADLYSRGKEIMTVRDRLNKNKQFYKIPNLTYEEKALELPEYFNQKYGINVDKIVNDIFAPRLDISCITRPMGRFELRQDLVQSLIQTKAGAR